MNLKCFETTYMKFYYLLEAVILEYWEYLGS